MISKSRTPFEKWRTPRFDMTLRSFPRARQEEGQTLVVEEPMPPEVEKTRRLNFGSHVRFLELSPHIDGASRFHVGGGGWNCD